MANEVVTQEKEMVYEVEGRTITLSPSLIRKYLVRGKGAPFTTAQEIAFFVGLCRARQMDPWAGDCYILRYGDKDPAAIVTSIDFVRARARANPDCQGWTCGVIVAGADGAPRDSSGLVLEGEKILGGWAECQPKGWQKPMRLEVNLAGYIKKTFDGKITKFWQAENQPTMIAKVAEMQILRRIWPAAAGKMYLAEEVGGPVLGEGMDLDIDMEPGGNGEKGTWEEKAAPEETVLEKFKRLAEENGISDRGDLEAFIRASAAATKKTEVEMQAAACADFPAFLKIFERSLAKKKQKEKELVEIEAAKVRAAAKKNEKPKGAEIGKVTNPEAPGPFPGPFEDDPQPAERVNPSTGEVTPAPGPFEVEQQDNRPDGTFIICTARKGDKMSLGFCRTNCPSLMDCEDCKPK